MILASGPTRWLGVDAERAPLSFGESDKPAGAWAGRRHLRLDGKPAFELSFWCGTCPAMFERLEGASHTLSLADLAEHLRRGLTDIDDTTVVGFGQLLPSGGYLPLLLEVQPRLVRPVEPGDYFAHEQVATWGIDTFSGLPETPRTPYYRTFQTVVSPSAHLYEFVVPMVPPSWNERDRVAEYCVLLEQTSTPTAVAVTILDICQPAMDDESTDYYEHWALTHFLLDGHHKFEAAAAAGRPLRLFGLVSIDGSLAREQDFDRLVIARGHTPRPRVPAS